MNLQILEQVFLGNRILDYIIAALALLAGLLFVKMVIRVSIARFKKFADKTSSTLDDFLVSILEKIALPALYLSCFYISLKMLKMPVTADKIINFAQLGILTFFAARLVTVLLGYILNTYLSKSQEDTTLVNSLEGMLRVVNFVIWALAAIIFLDNIGFKVSTIIAGLGIGGIAVAIAAQALLKEFFSYFAIVFDQPFKIGDFIIVGDFMGTVEHIGVKTTRIRSLGGEQLVFSNTDLTDSRVRNYMRMEKRRVLFNIGVTYETSLNNLKEIPKIIENVIKNTKDAAFDRAHFFSYGDFSLVFEIVYFVLSPDYNKYMDIQQEVNFAIKEQFDKRGIEFAYPTQKLYLSNESKN